MDPNVTPAPPDGGTPPAEGAIPAASPPAQPDPAAALTDDKKGGVQDRIDQLTREKYANERDAAYWKGVAESQQAPAPAPAPAPAVETKELDPDNFDTQSDYLKAVAAETREEIRAQAKADRDGEAAIKTQQTLTTQYAKGREKYTDFDAVALAQTHPVTQDMFNAAQGDNLPDILHALGKNPDEARRIAVLPPTQQIKEIGKIEARLGATPDTTIITNAPNPPQTLGGGGGSPPAKAESEMSRTELHAKWEAERIAGSRG